MSTSHQPSKIPSQARELRMEPDPEEPSFSYEEQLVYNNLLQKEDDFHRLLMQTNHRIRTSSTTTIPNNNSNNNNNHGNSNQEVKTDCKPTLRSSVVNFQNGNDGITSTNTDSVCSKQ
jgi:hypothetical protein